MTLRQCPRAPDQWIAHVHDVIHPPLAVQLPHGAAQAEELQVVTALHHFVRLFGEMLREGEGEVMRLLFLDGALVGAGFDLVEQNAAGPAELRGGAEIVEAGGWVGERGKQIGVMSPRNRHDQFSHSL